MTVGELSHWILSSLTPKYGQGESRSMLRIIMEDVLNYSPVQAIMHRDTDMPDFITPKIGAIINRLLADEPIQYILGQARFCGLMLHVTPDVLIPRQETEGLVDMIVKQWGNVPDVRVLDMCTGSGCIAVALARSLRFPAITATDISPDALSVARGNAAGLRLKINFQLADARSMPADHSEAYDIIVSNPPYVAEHERASMPANVNGHEPDLALFVPDSDPLLFYRAIAAYASHALTQRGKLYLEINPLYVRELDAELKRQGLKSVTFMADMHGRQRYAIAAKD